MEIAGIWEKIVLGFKHWQFGNKAQLGFLEDLYLLINDGIPANRAIEMLAQVTDGVGRDVALSLTEKISEGQPLADGMREWFSMNVVEVIRVGESGGALAETIKSAINMLSTSGATAGAFVGALLYPGMVIGMACGLIIYLNTSVFTQFRLIKPVSQWPPAGQELVVLAQLIQYWWWIVVVIVVAVFIGLRRFLSNYTGQLRPILDRFPPFSFYRQLVSARLLETLGLLVSNGVSFKAALSVLQLQSTPYLLQHLIQMEQLLGMGKTNIADVLDTGLVDQPDILRLRIMAEVKGIEHGLVRMGVRGTEKASHTLKLIAKMLGGVGLVIGGTLIIMIMRGIYLTGMAMGGQ